MSYLVLTEIFHLSTAVVLFMFFSLLFGPVAAAWAFVGAFLIDADHMFDYLFYLRKSRRRFEWKSFFHPHLFIKKTRRIFLLAHSWELSAALVGLYFVYDLPVLLVLGFSMFVHLVVDQLTNDVRPPAYFLVWRVVHGFDLEVICSHN